MEDKRMEKDFKKFIWISRGAQKHLERYEQNSKMGLGFEFSSMIKYFKVVKNDGIIRIYIDT